MGRSIRWSMVAALVSLAWLAQVAHAEPENGWWWNSNESGRGFFIEIQDTQVYLAGYFYADDGRAMWLVSQGNTSTPTTYSGRLLSFAGGQTLVGNYHPPGAAVDVGAIAINFTDDRHATLTWPGGTALIERQYFDPASTDFAPKTGWWWNDAESGRGYSVEVQGNNLFMVGFMYDGTGNPLWYFSAGPLTSPTSYAGALLQFANGQTLTGPYKPPGTPATIGTVTLEFTAPDEGTMTLADTVGVTTDGVHPKVPAPKMLTIKPQFKTKPAPLPAAWEGNFSEVSTNHLSGGGVSIDDRAEFDGTLTWIASNLATGQTSYSPLGAVDLSYIYRLDSLPQTCDAALDKKGLSLHTKDGDLTLRSDDSYNLALLFEFTFPVTTTCVTKNSSGGTTTTTTTSDKKFQITMLRTGHRVGNLIQGAPKPFVVAPTFRRSTTWNFKAKP